MKREEILNNTHLIKRFCKDSKVPINVFHNPYFEQRLDILDEIFACKHSFDVFVREIEDFSSEQDYYAYYNELKDKVIQDIKENPYFQKFNTMPMDYPKSLYPSKDFYKMQFDGKSIISIDMRKANFSALSFYDARIFGNAGSWEEFLGRYTQYNHIINSKYIRQVIMGTCNPKRQVTYEKHLMSLMLEMIMPSLPEFEVYSLSHDEVILTFPEDFNDFDAYYKVLDVVKTTPYSTFLRVSIFHLNKLSATDGWKRSIFCEGENSFDFKKLNADYYHQAVKFDRGEHITMDDLVIYHDGFLARLLNPVF